MNFYSQETQNALEAQRAAQYLAFAPMIFQAVLLLRDLGVLQALEESKNQGLSLESLCEKLSYKKYQLQVLLESGLSGGVVLQDEQGFYKLSKMGWFILNDSMTRVNMDFSQDVCYEGLFKLKDSLLKEKPEGLKVFGAWPTIYQGLMSLPDQVQKSWFAFDHFYSDNSFDQALKSIFATAPKSILDVGGNTGKWSLKCLEYNDEVKMGIADLGPQCRAATQNITLAGYSDRFQAHPTDLLDPESELPKGYDLIWMSQFLDCFSEDEVKMILAKAQKSMSPQSELWIMEICWDRQDFETAALCLHQTSLYFTAMANGNSKMFDSRDLTNYVKDSGLKIVEVVDGLGLGHTLFKCVLD
jgi:hypothetical protein